VQSAKIDERDFEELHLEFHNERMRLNDTLRRIYTKPRTPQVPGTEWSLIGDIMPGAIWRRLNGLPNRHLVTEVLCTKSTSIRNHWHEHDEFITVVDGSGFFVIHGKRFDIKRGSSAKIQKGILHSGTYTDKTHLLIIFYDFFDTDQQLSFHVKKLLPELDND